MSWRLDDVMPKGTRLDFSKRFLPERLASTEQLALLLDDDSRKTLNQISANAYLTSDRNAQCSRALSKWLV